MKRLLSLLALGLLTAAASAQVTFDPTQVQRGMRSRPTLGGTTNSPPVTNPEPLTVVALAGGAAVAGGLLRRRKQASKQAK
jgi:hypothetical protein